MLIFIPDFNSNILLEKKKQLVRYLFFCLILFVYGFLLFIMEMYF